MKNNTHPTYYPDAQVVCSCGHKFTTGSTIKDIHVDICSNCHPFFTGEMKFVDTQGRVERFESMRQKAQSLQQTRGKKKKNQAVSDDSDSPKTLKEMLEDVKSKSATQ